MKRFLSINFVYIIIILIIAGIVEYAVRRLPNVIKYKANYIMENWENIQVLIFGSSNPYVGIDPDLFDKNTFNIAYVSQCLQMDWQIFEKNKSNLNNLEVVILPIAYYSLWHKLAESPESWRMKDYVAFYGIKSNKLIQNSLFLSQPKESMIGLINYHIKGKKDLSCMINGMSKWNVTEKSRKFHDNSIDRVALHSYDIDSPNIHQIYNENLAVLEKFADYCYANNVKLVLPEIPTHSSYYEKLDQYQLYQMQTAIQTVKDKWSSIKHLDWLTHSDFDTSDFLDSDHLNSDGVEKFSVKLNTIIFSPIK